MFDPIVVAAVVALVSGVVIKVADEFGQGDRGRLDQAFKREQSRCDRAYGFLQDDALHPTSKSDMKLYEINRSVVERCAFLPQNGRKPE